MISQNKISGTHSNCWVCEAHLQFTYKKYEQNSENLRTRVGNIFLQIMQGEFMHMVAVILLQYKTTLYFFVSLVGRWSKIYETFDISSKAELLRSSSDFEYKLPLPLITSPGPKFQGLLVLWF